MVVKNKLSVVVVQFAKNLPASPVFLRVLCGFALYSLGHTKNFTQSREERKVS